MRTAFHPNGKDFRVNRAAIRARQMAALQTRHTAGLTDKVIGRAIERHPETVGNWRLGLTEMGAGDLIALEEFFASPGDFSFIEQMCGDLAARRRARAAQLQAQAAKLLESAALLESEAA